MDEETIKRAKRILSFLSFEESIDTLIEIGNSYEDAWLACYAGKILLKDEAIS